MEWRVLEDGLKYNKNISYVSWQDEEHNKDLRFDITCPHMHVQYSGLKHVAARVRSTSGLGSMTVLHVLA